MLAGRRLDDMDMKSSKSNTYISVVYLGGRRSWRYIPETFPGQERGLDGREHLRNRSTFPAVVDKDGVVPRKI